MDTIELTFRIFEGDKCTIAINGSVIPSYSVMNDYVNQPVLNWAGDFLREAYNELNVDEYEIILNGATLFEKKLFDNIQIPFNGELKGCKRWTVGKEKDSVDLKSMFRRVRADCERKGVNITDGYKVGVLCPDRQALPEDYAYYEKDLDKAGIIIVSGSSELNSIIASVKRKIIVCPADEERIEILERKNYVWYAKPESVFEAVSIISERFAVPDYLSAISSSAMSSDPTDDSIPESDERKEAEEDILQSVGIGPGLEKMVTVKLPEDAVTGDVFKPEIIIQDCGTDINVRFESRNKKVINVDRNGTALVAVSPGKANIRFYINQDTEPFFSQIIKVYEDNLVREIRLSCPEKLRIGSETRLEAETFPKYAAEDDVVSWESDDPDVLEIAKDGTVKAKKLGVVNITAKTKRAEAKASIEVVDISKSLTLSTDNITCYIKRRNTVTVTQDESAIPEEILFKSSNERVAVVTKTSEKEFEIESTGIGEATVSFFSKDGALSSELNVTVKSTLENHPERKSLFCGLCVLFTLCAVILLMLFSDNKIISYVDIGVAGTAFLLGIAGFIENKKNALTLIIMILISLAIVGTRASTLLI